jgi:WD40 repeat protein
MAEPGGPTTQSGILYQNSIASLYLGRMLDPEPWPKSDRVIGVRVEAPTEVDDVVVIFEDGHTAYIQAKENIEPRGEVWEKMWRHLEAQLGSRGFKRCTDRLVLHLGMIQPWHRSLLDLCQRAGTSKTHSELEQRLSKPLRHMLAGISDTLQSPAAPALLELLQHVDIEILSTTEAVRDLAPRWMPASNISPSLLFDKLLHLVSEGSTVRRTFDREWLQASLENDGVQVMPSDKTPPRRIPFMAPDLPADFVARPEEFEQLMSALLDNNAGSAIGITATAALRGAGGYGKTTLASAVCHDTRIKAAFPAGIMWATIGETPGDLTGRVQDLIQAMTGERPSFGHINAAAAHLAELIKDCKALLVIDDVWQREHLAPFTQGGPGVARLITTRNRDNLPAKCRTVDVDAMKQAEAVSLLGAGLDERAVKANYAELQRLSSWLGEWPLLLKLVNAVLARRAESQPLDQAMLYVTALLDKKGISAFDNTTSEGREQSVARTVEVSLDFLTPNERERFVELAVFPEDVDVPVATVGKLWEARGGLDELDTEQLCDKLKGFSLLLRFDPGERVIRLHDVIRKYLIQAQGRGLPAIHSALLDAHAPDSGCWSDLPDDEPYMWDQLAYHLVEAERPGELARTARDLYYLAKKSLVRDALGAEQDLMKAQACAPQDAAVAALNRGFAQWGHVLNSLDKINDVAATLHSRVRYVEELTPPLERLVELLVERLERPYLTAGRPLPDLPHPALVRVLSGHSLPVTGCAISPDGTRAVSASWDKTLKVWDLRTGKELMTLAGHSGSVNGCAISPDGTGMVSASSDNTLKVWDLRTGKELMTLAGHSAYVYGCAISPDGTRAVSASMEPTLKVWDLRTGKELITLSGHSNSVTGCAISPDGTRVVSASEDHTLKVWELGTGKELMTLSGHSHYVHDCAISADGTRVVSASLDNTLKVWDLRTGKELMTLAGHSYYVWGCAISADGTRVVSASWDKTLKVWELDTGKELMTLAGHSDCVRGCAISADGTRVVSGSEDKTLKVWELGTGKELITLSGHSDSVRGCAISLDGTRVVSASDDNTLKVWELGTGKELMTLSGHSYHVSGCAISPDGRRVVSASADNKLKVWDLRTGKELITLAGHSHYVNGCAISPNAKRVVSASLDNTLKVWDLRTGKELMTLSGHSGWVNGCAISPDGTRVVSASSDNTLKVWNLRTGKALMTMTGHSGWVHGCAISPDGTRVVSASADNTLKVWDLRAGKELMTLSGHSSIVNGCAIGPDGTWVVSASVDHTMKVWDLNSGDCLATLAVDARLYSCAISPDGGHVVAVGARGVYFLRLVT